MAMNPLPPQAYTKDTLLKAYSWLQNQNESIKSLAITPDILVSLYLKAKMNGEESLERPSIQNFKSELKNLAGLMGEFEAKTEKPAWRPVEKSVDKTVEKSPMPSPNLAHSTASRGDYPYPEAQSLPPPEMIRPTPAPAPASGSIQDLDDRTRIMIREVKSQFNLSTEQEALRLLVSIGFKRMKDLE